MCFSFFICILVFVAFLDLEHAFLLMFVHSLLYVLCPQGPPYKTLSNESGVKPVIVVSLEMSG